MKIFHILHKNKMVRLMSLLSIISFYSMYSTQALASTNSQSWIKRASGSVVDIWQNGYWDGYITGYGWHGKGYSDQRRKELNQYSYGGGVGKRLVDENGNQDLLYGFVFLDSHNKPQPIIGYGKQWFKKVFYLLSLGGGYTAAITARSDMLNGAPIPIILPVFSIKVLNTSLMGTFLPKLGVVNKGNVLFVWGRIEF